MRTETPLGAIIARAATDPNHPGIYIDLRRGSDDPDMPLALVEFSADDADFMDGVENLITRVWGDAMQEDYRFLLSQLEQVLVSGEVAGGVEYQHLADLIVRHILLQRQVVIAQVEQVDLLEFLR